jgi:hypothetical protein
MSEILISWTMSPPTEVNNQFFITNFLVREIELLKGHETLDNHEFAILGVHETSTMWIVHPHVEKVVI